MTLERVAKRAGVSVATVSRALHTPERLKESTRKRVLRAVQELNYRPNRNAQLLAGLQSRTLGMVVSNLSNPFFVDIFASMEEAARREGYEVVVEQTGYSGPKLVSSIHSMVERRVAGLAVIVSEMDHNIMGEIERTELPVVIYDVGSPGAKITNIRVRYETGMRRMVQYLYALGHRRLALVCHHSSLAPLQARRKSFIDSASQFGSEVTFEVAGNIDSPAGGMQAVHDLISTGFRPTAIVCSNDYMAIGALRAVVSHGWSVPQDVSVSGFDNITFSEFTNPSLTTVNIPRRRVGEMAVEALLGKTDDGIASEIVLEPELVVRDSTGPAARSAS